MSLRHIGQKIKPFYDLIKNGVDEAILCLIITISVVDAFAIGYISNIDTAKEISISNIPTLDFSDQPDQNREGTSVSTESGPIVASKNGTKYYKITCSGVNRIKNENKVYFQSIEEAVRAGYGPASGCF